MKFSTLQEDLNKGLSIVYRFVNPHPQIPILSHILLGIEKGRIRLCSTNLESGINYFLGAKIEKEGITTIQARVFLEVIENLPPGKIDFEAINGAISIHSSGSTITIPTSPPNEFPVVPLILPKNQSTLDKEWISTLTRQVSFSAAIGEEVRPEYTGILFSPQQTDVFVVATDGVRLSQKQVKLPKVFSEKFLVPARIIAEIPKILPPNTKQVTIAFNKEDNQVLFGVEDVVVSTRLLDVEKFPDYEKIIPTSWNTTVTLAKEEFEPALKLSSVFAKDFVVKLTFNSDGCSLTSADPQTGEQTTTLSGKIEGDELTVSFNWRFINDFLNAVDGEEVQLRFLNSTSPAMFTNPKDESFLHLIMPVRASE